MPVARKQPRAPWHGTRDYSADEKTSQDGGTAVARRPCRKADMPEGAALRGKRRGGILMAMSDLQRESVQIPFRRPGINRWLRFLFVALGPISLAGYLLTHVWLNLTGACYNLVIESTLSPLLGRPVAMSNRWVYLLSPLIVLVAPLAAAVHGLMAFGRAVAAGLVRLGRWQTGLSSRPTAGALGLVWALLLAWMAVACLDPRTGWQLLGRDLPGLKEYRRAADMGLLMGELPGQMQQRRQFLLSGTEAAREALQQLAGRDGDAEVLRNLLARQDWALMGFGPRVQRYLSGLPWYYRFGPESSDGQERATMLGGCLLLAVVLMVRWPGMGFLARGGVAGLASYAARVGGAAAVVIAAFAGGVRDAERYAGVAAVILIASMAILMLYWLTWKASAYWRLPRQYSPFLAMRLLQRKRIALFSVGAVTLCVAMVLIVVSVMGGFLDMVRDRSRHLLGDLVLDGSLLNGFAYYQEFIDKIRQWPQVEAATPVIYSYGLLRYESGETQPVQVVGLRLDGADEVHGFKSTLYYEEWYPGTTTLREQPQYVYGIDRQERPVLPDVLEKALAASKAWRDLQKDPDKAARYQRTGGRLIPVFPGPGVFEMNDPKHVEPGADSPWILPPGEVGPLLPGVIIGRDIIAERQASGEYYRYPSRPRGMRVTLTLMPIGRGKGGLSSQSTPLNKPFRYVDDSRTGVYEIDSQSVYVDFDLLQDLLLMGKGKKVDGGVVRPRASQVQIKVKPGVELQAFKDDLNAAWQEMIEQADDPVDQDLMRLGAFKTWEEKQQAFISAVEKEKILVSTLFGVISVVAIFLILCIFYMIVVEKTRDIGIIKSVGGSAGGVAAVFLSYGAAIGVVGSVLGVILGAIFVHYINDIQDWLARLNPELRVWKADVYSFESIPNVVKPQDAFVIGVIAVMAAIVGALVPALIAARKHPVESLRYE